MVEISTLFSLAGKTALITGGGRGLGKAMALHLARCGADVWISGRNADTLETACSEAISNGLNLHPLVMDVSKLDTIRTAFSRIASETRTLDILVNNAGDETLRACDDVDEALWNRLLDTNLKGPFFVAQQAARLMPDGGSIINLASLTSAAGVAKAVPYSASKSGILGLTRSLAVEWAPRGIRINALAPGYFHTDMTDTFFRNDAWREKMLAGIPLARFGLPDDLAGPLQFLCSTASAYITGQVLYVDGGTLAAL
ncbi:SDR family NAD(P)-dependent oxidoreductase [Gluconobacter wancherniae]|uniref:2-deoxy-D-gluconate 3-dehydrogenase n=1 Tax=Gluconobacter wancherniae NBRC 103581 TaxID=656744 RepID=A0A511B1X5_9PROT|nr:SDR family oxidoreductase [Gluconobacter wancherniae]MBF0853792.1 SDR family oxidoreductase [Gluconobacter wancherniae]GBD55456.1 2-deoxy-D-gluconate 3-dehydrogenase [Gluconobacter wancherniae NBRC 103581]GBR66743.1 3-oxoacyl-ACP reductase [Gluconobacter wancherniae NBRC 103581]GEK93643.1 2-deoxy-D-gluconate 3-dehydrogenase [Gluconobacter wancherniae NBRC 103581]